MTKLVAGQVVRCRFDEKSKWFKGVVGIGSQGTIYVAKESRERLGVVCRAEELEIVPMLRPDDVKNEIERIASEGEFDPEPERAHIIADELMRRIIEETALHSPYAVANAQACRELFELDFPRWCA